MLAGCCEGAHFADFEDYLTCIFAISTLKQSNLVAHPRAEFQHLRDDERREGAMGDAAVAQGFGHAAGRGRRGGCADCAATHR